MSDFSENDQQQWAITFGGALTYPSENVNYDGYLVKIDVQKWKEKAKIWSEENLNSKIEHKRKAIVCWREGYVAL